MYLKELTKQCLAVFALVGLIMAAGELALRSGMFDIILEGEGRSTNELAYQVHPSYLIGLKPGLNRSFRWREQGKELVSHWTTNSMSFRGPEPLDHSALRVMVYGDSNVFAMFSNEIESFTFRLQEELRHATGQMVEVVNAGVPGFGPDQSVLRFEEEVNKYKPDIVVLHLFADNDLGDIIRNRLFSLSSSGSLVREPAPRDVDPCLAQDPCIPPGNPGSRVREALRSLRIVQLTRQSFRVIEALRPLIEPSAESTINYYLSLSEQEYRIYADAQPRQISHFIDHYDYDVALYPDAESSRTKVRLLERILQYAREVAKAKHVHLVLLIQPSSQDLTTHIRPNYTDLRRYPGYRPDTLSRVLEQAAIRQQIPFVNLYDIFSAHDPDTLYFHDDDHWNSKGQQLAARAVATYLTEHATPLNRGTVVTHVQQKPNPKVGAYRPPL